MNRLLFACALALLAALPAVAQPDLFPTTPGVSPARLDPGASLSVFFLARNSGDSGNQDAPPFEVAFYVSTDRYLSDDDLFVDRVTVPGVSSGGSVPVNESLTVPSVPRGGYFLIVSVDDPDTVPETDETNNVGADAFTVGGTADGPDLLITTGELEDATAAPGDRVSVEYTVANIGGSGVGDFEVGYYLALINRPPTEWIFLEREVLGGLDPGEDNDESEQVTIPMSVPPGEYGFAIWADDRNAVEERNETNNILGISRITITGTTAVGDDPIDSSLSLLLWPNPAYGPVRLTYTLGAPGHVRLSVYDALGREVAVVVDAEHWRGEHMASLDSATLAPGVYVVHLNTSAGRAVGVPLTIVR